MEQEVIMAMEHGQSSDYVTLYRRAFAEYGPLALWNIRSFENPAPGDALVVARALRNEGNLQARQLAEDIERACRAVV
jgi:hypothetical protein